MRRLIQAAAHDPVAMGPLNTFKAFASLDAAHQHLQQAYFADSLRSASYAASTSTANRPSQSRLSAVTWSLLALGLMASVCGGVLLGWSLLAGRTALWTCGMPITLGGQLRSWSASCCAWISWETPIAGRSISLKRSTRSWTI